MKRWRSVGGWAAVGAGAVLALLVLRPGERPDTDPAAVAAPPPEAVDVDDRRGALVDQVVFTQESDLGRAVELIQSGTLHAVANQINSTTVFRRVRTAPGLAYDISYGSSAELTVNPVGPRFDDGRINPFHVREIRQALNWLIDRRHVAEELYGGLAVPRYLPLDTVSPDYARVAETARRLELEYGHDPERARRVIAREMEALGATLRDGRWRHDGEVVRLAIVIRTDDQRRAVGDYVANRLEDMGFAVDRLYRAPDEASRIWIAGDPAAGQWHLYTGGWLSVLVRRDLGDNFNYYYTARGRPEPLWQAYDPDPEFDELADRLARGDYRTVEEREAMLSRAMELAMAESYRVWLVDVISAWPRSDNLELAVDLAGGMSGSRLWPYTLRFRDRLGGRAVFGLPNLLTEPWNPVAGSNWVFDRMILRALDNPTVIPDPFTGLFWPQTLAEAQVTVQRDVPTERTLDWLTLDREDEIPVPGDAWVDWDSQEQRWITVAERYPDGVNARTRVVVRYEDDYLQRRWHDGSRLSLADIVLPWILTFERSDESSPYFDPAEVPTFEAFRRHFRGWRIVSTEPLVIEIHSDQIYPDAEWIVAQRAPVALPWHTLNLGLLAEERGELAFSSAKADRERVDWMSLVAGPSLPVLRRQLEFARERNLVPFANVLADYMTGDEAAGRYAALSRWHERRGHFWVGNGPFQLRSVHPVERTVVLDRFEEFPDPADKWLRFAQARVPALDIDGPMTVTHGEAATFELDISFDGEPYPTESVERVRYLLFDRGGSLLIDGDAESVGDGRWRVSLDEDRVRRLDVGANSLEVTVTSREVAMPVFASHGFATVRR